MNIALLTDSDVFAGTERHMLDLAVELRALGEEPTLVCPGAGALAARAGAEGLRVKAAEKRGAVDPGLVGLIGQAWHTGEFDVVHAHNGRTALHAALARTLAPRGALVATQHFLTPAREGRRGPGGVAGRMIHGAAGKLINRHVAISRAVGDAMLTRGDTPPARLRVVLNGIRDPLDEPSPGREEAMGRWRKAGQPLIVCLARLEPEKGLHTLIDAMESVARRLPGAVCLVAGDGSLATELQVGIDRLGTNPPVNLLGFVEDARSLLAAADLCVLPSVAEPFGLSLVEAMALGVPVVSTRAGGPPEIVREAETGLLVPPGDAPALADAIVSILRDDEARAAMGRAARTDFLERFTARRMAAEMLDVYRHISGVQQEKVGAVGG